MTPVHVFLAAKAARFALDHELLAQWSAWADCQPFDEDRVLSTDRLLRPRLLFEEVVVGLLTQEYH